MPSPIFAVLWYAACVVGAYIWVGGDAGLSALLASPLERAAAAVAVGTVRAAWGEGRAAVVALQSAGGLFAGACRRRWPSGRVLAFTAPLSLSPLFAQVAPAYIAFGLSACLSMLECVCAAARVGLARARICGRARVRRRPRGGFRARAAWEREERMFVARRAAAAAAASHACLPSLARRAGRSR